MRLMVKNGRKCMAQQVTIQKQATKVRWRCSVTHEAKISVLKEHYIFNSNKLIALLAVTEAVCLINM